MSFRGDRLKRLREERDLTQDDLAKKISVSRPTLSKYESGDVDISTETAVLLADIFDVSTDYLLGKSDVRHHVVTRAAHATGDLSKEELEKVEEYIKFIKSQRSEP